MLIKAFAPYLSKNNKIYPMKYAHGFLMLCFAVVILPSLTHWGRDKMAAIFQTTFSNAFSWMKMFEFRLRFHWSLFPRVQLTIFQHWFRSGDKPLSEPMMVSLLTDICVTWPQWVNEFMQFIHTDSSCLLQWHLCNHISYILVNIS